MIENGRLDTVIVLGSANKVRYNVLIDGTW